MAELHDVAVAHDVVLAFDAGLARGAGGGHGARRDQVVVGDHLGLDEAPLEVAVDDAGRLRCRGAGLDRPGPGFLRARGEEGLQAERAEAGLGEPGLAQLAKAGFRALGLQTFLTAGPKETRAWTIKAGATAPEAAGVIHSDFQRGFIKAEVISYDDLIAAGSVAAARAAGKARIEGKDYIMRDGDVVEFRFNV